MNLHGILSFWGKADIAIFLIRDGQTVFWIENEYGGAPPPCVCVLHPSTSTTSPVLKKP